MLIFLSTRQWFKSLFCSKAKVLKFKNLNKAFSTLAFLECFLSLTDLWKCLNRQIFVIRLNRTDRGEICKEHCKNGNFEKALLSFRALESQIFKQ